MNRGNDMCMRDTTLREKVRFIVEDAGNQATQSDMEDAIMLLISELAQELAGEYRTIRTQDKRIAELEQELAIGVNNVIRGLETENLSLKKEVDNTGGIVDKLDEELTEVKAHNALLLEDKNASPAIIAGYRDYNTRLIEQLRIRGERMERIYRNLPLKLQVYLKDMGEFDDNGKAL